jgi:hypothetical protein
LAVAALEPEGSSWFISREDGDQPSLNLVLLSIHGTLGAIPAGIVRLGEVSSLDLGTAETNLPSFAE